MAFDWRDYLQLARALVGQHKLGGVSEAAQRSAVSRAYYAAFCFARNYAESKLGFRRTGGGADHKRLREYLEQKGRVGLASDLNRLRGWRNECDYGDNVRNVGQYAQNAIRIAEGVIEECR